MPKIMMDEFHLQVFVSDRLDPAASEAIRRVLNSKRFQTALGNNVRSFFKRYAPLAKLTIKIAA